ncbi:hypothetical protein M413DRAFT_292228 [Hebeloma cylindrosporum]|uniref:Uncharacterized protein n=1 Tax=Hebeloma cylindrosporum TaxID=76867 RepID=A0A0C3BI13_HEBCY|nr:hypothetical protein M413DRAFT_292228 [Hebeloma cylindrosporum h7]
MGARHQAFLIARIVPHGSPKTDFKYRCIGALHHQSCHDHLPVKAAARFVTLIKQEDNAAIITEELKAINGLYGRFMEDPKIPDIPCPFTHFLFMSAWSAELSDGKRAYLATASSLEASMGTIDLDNNTGITIIDITDPTDPSYCFFPVIDRHFPETPPLSANDYLAHNHHLSVHDGDGDTSAFFTLKAIPLLTFQQLAEAWPIEYARAAAFDSESESSDSESESSDPESEVDSGSDVDMDSDQSDESSTSSERSAIAPALEQLLLHGVNTGMLEIILSTPENGSRIKEVLRSRQGPIPEPGVTLLSKILNRELHGQRQKSVDISQFPLSCQEILSIVTQHPDLQLLNISSNSQVTIDCVEKLLDALPKLRRLTALNTGITDEDAIRFLERRPDLFRNLEGFIHPAFLNSPSHAQFKGVYLHISDSFFEYKTYAVSLPFFTMGQIIQGLTDYLKALKNTTYGFRTSAMDPVMAVYASQVREAGQLWGERVVPFIPGASSPAKSLVRKGHQWVFSILPFGHIGYLRYTFARVNGEVWDECLRRTEQIDEELGTRDSSWIRYGKDRKEKIAKLREELGPRIFNVCDVPQFFKELELEGREPPSPEALDHLFDLFATLNEGRGPGIRLMDADDLLELVMKHL